LNLIQIIARSVTFINITEHKNRIPIKTKIQYNRRLKIAIIIPITINKRPNRNRDDIELFILF